MIVVFSLHCSANSACFFGSRLHGPPAEQSILLADYENQQNTYKLMEFKSPAIAAQQTASAGSACLHLAAPCECVLAELRYNNDYHHGRQPPPPDLTSVDYQPVYGTKKIIFPNEVYFSEEQLRNALNSGGYAGGGGGSDRDQVDCFCSAGGGSGIGGGEQIYIAKVMAPTTAARGRSASPPSSSSAAAAGDGYDVTSAQNYDGSPLRSSDVTDGICSSPARQILVQGFCQKSLAAAASVTAASTASSTDTGIDVV